jgi:hypothetical protein
MEYCNNSLPTLQYSTTPILQSFSRRIEPCLGLYKTYV